MLFLLLVSLGLFSTSSTSAKDLNARLGKPSYAYNDLPSPHAIRFKRNSENVSSRELRPASKTLKLNITDYEVTVNPKVISVDSSSAKIFWTLGTRWRGDSLHAEEVNISLKVNFRPFASVTTREILLTIHESSLKDDYQENTYTVNNLVSDTGYVFCFSLLLSGDYYETFNANGIETDHDTQEFPLPQTEKNEIDPWSPKPQELPNQNETITQTTERISKPDPVYSPTPDTKLPQQGPFINFPSPRSRSQLPLPADGNFAYTSTGELIYLSPSSWRPSRKKRSTAGGGGGDGLESERFCVEVITKAHLPLSVVSPIMILIYLVILVILVVFMLILIYPLRKCYRRYNDKKLAEKIRTKGDDAKAQAESKVSSSNLDQSDLSFHSHKITPALTPKRLQSFSKAFRDLNEPLSSNAAYQRSPEEQGEYVFHPGYEIPPSSTMEVYGYDFPKASNRMPTTPVTPSTSSCELNANEFVWDFPESKCNFNIPPDSNRSDGYGKDTKPKKHFPQTLFPKRPQVHETPDSSNLSKCTGCNNRTCQCSAATSRRPSQSPLNSLFHPRDNGAEGNSLSRREKLNNLKVGERVTISGGTLLEVPEGYVIPRPNPSERIKIIVKGPVDL